jgi:hypothetical protein
MGEEIEEELYKLHGNTVDVKYKTKYRSLVHNLRINTELLDNIITRQITPYNLVRMTSAEMACKELAEWREKSEKHVSLVYLFIFLPSSFTFYCKFSQVTQVSIRSEEKNAENEF